MEKKWVGKTMEKILVQSNHVLSFGEVDICVQQGKMLPSVRLQKATALLKEKEASANSERKQKQNRFWRNSLASIGNECKSIETQMRFREGFPSCILQKVSGKSIFTCTMSPQIRGLNQGEGDTFSFCYPVYF